MFDPAVAANPGFPPRLPAGPSPEAPTASAEAAGGRGNPVCLAERFDTLHPAKAGEGFPHALSGGGRPVETPERSRERIVALRASHVANIKRLIRKLEAVVKYPGDDWCELEALDAARFVWDADGLDTLMQDALFDLRVDREGYPLTDEGDTDPHGDRRYTPMGAL